MKHRRIPKRRAAVAGAGIAALVAAGVTFQTANASEVTKTPAPETLSIAAAGKLASTLGKDLGADAAGTYYDAKTKLLVVNVLDETAAKTVQAAGAQARIVENSLAELTSARTTLKNDATIPGTSWATDPQTNKVVVTADSTVSKAELAKLTEVVEGLGSKAELQRTKGSSSPSSRAATRSPAPAGAARSASTWSRAASRTSSPPGTAPRRSPPGPRAEP